MGTVLPAVTCSAQSTLLTGLLPREHGIVGNGWYFRDLAEVLFWRQSNHLVQGERLYEAGRRRDPSLHHGQAVLVVQHVRAVDWSMTPRPSYPADGRKVFDSYSQPPELKDELQARLGVFPLLRFWGPGADITSTRWIADAAIQVLAEHQPDAHARLPAAPRLQPAAARAGRSADCRGHPPGGRRGRAAHRRGPARGAEVVVLSEYAITAVRSAGAHQPRAARARLSARAPRALGWETLDAGASRAFAVADHQVAHVYVQRAEDVPAVAELLRRTGGGAGAR